MKLIQFLSSRFIIISLFFSSATWAQPIFFKTDVDNPVSVPFFIDDEDTEAVDKPNYPLALIAPNIQNSNAWLTSEAIATVCVGALIIGSLGLAFKYRAVIHRTIFNGLRPAAIVVEQAVEQLTDNSVIDTSSETMPETEAAAAPEIFASITMDRAVEMVQDSLRNKRIQRRDNIVRGIINSISKTKYSRATASKGFASQIPEIQQTIIKDIVFLIDNGQFYMM